MRKKTDKKADAASGSEPITIKKYANRRLYNTQTSSYVTLDYLADMVKAGKDFLVFDAKSGEDITRSVLTQIIFEEESKGQNLLPVRFLRQLIRFYGDSMQAFVPSYLDMSMEAFSRNQERLRGQVTEALGGTPGYKLFEDSVRQNMAFVDQAMRMFTPFGGRFPGGGASNQDKAPDAEQEADAEPAAPDANTPDETAETIESLRDEIAALQEQLKKLSEKD